MEYFEAYLRDMKAQGRSKSTIYNYSSHLATFRKWCEATGIDYKSAKPKDFRLFRNYLVSLDYSPHTVNMHLYCLKSFYDFLTEEEVVKGNPVITGRLTMKERKRTPGFLADEELEAVLQEIEKRPEIVRIVFRVMLATGLRVSEAVMLAPEDVQQKENIVLVHVRKGKGCKERWAPVIDGSTATELLQMKQKMQGKSRLFKITASTIQYHARQISKAVGFDFHPHRLRHTVATNLLNKGWPLDVVQEVLGHENIATTRRYAVTLPKSFFQVAATIY